MKKIILLALAIIAFNSGIAQPPPTPSIQIYNNNGPGNDGAEPSCTGTLSIVFYAVDNTGANIGYTSPVSLPASGTTSAILDYSSFTWIVDPLTPSSTNDWGFDRVTVYNCNTPSSGTPNCGPNGNRDGFTLDINNSNDCFEYSAACSSCGATTEMHGNLAPGGYGGVSSISIFKP